tara:strand:- start:163 stop:552 length:390 start_codon:yes stop_codon:yes gene_type:complete
LIDKNCKIKLNHSEIFLRADGIVEIHVHENADIGEKECIDIMNAYEQILEPKKYPLLHLVGNYVTMDKEAREFSSSEEGLRFSKAEAFVINSLPHKILANFYMKMNKPTVPTKFFGTKQEAVAWLKKFL